MTSANETAIYCADLVSGLADGGVDTVFVSPGSRNTPLTLAFVREPRIKDISIRDERSAGFTALGYGKTTGRPAAVLCTSGSAATHYYPAVVEADQSSTPLIVLTADRPARLRGTGAPQTMDQMNLYGTHTKTFTDLDVRSANGKSDGAVLAAIALTHPGGPAHANVALDEPLVPDALAEAPEPAWRPTTGRSDRTGGDIVSGLHGRDVIIVAGGRQRPEFGSALRPVATALGAPILADPQCWIVGENSVRFGDLLASSTDLLNDASPDVVLRLGALPTSKPIWRWLEQSGVEQILVDGSRLRDPLSSAQTVVNMDPTEFLETQAHHEPPGGLFLEKWLAMDSKCDETIGKTIDGLPFPNEPAIARSVIESVRPGELVHVGSSMPIRDVDSFAIPRDDITVLANRGVNGIDGTISTALGAALAGKPVTLLVGDVAALHDATALAEAVRFGVPLRIVVVNNDGGGIFSFLPQSTSDTVPHDVYERHWGTPHGLSLCGVAQGFEMNAKQVASRDEFLASIAAPITAPELIELLTNRDENTAHHRAIRDGVRSIGGYESS